MYQKQKMAAERADAEGRCMLDIWAWAQSEEFCDCHLDELESLRSDGELLRGNYKRYYNCFQRAGQISVLFCVYRSAQRNMPLKRRAGRAASRGKSSLLDSESTFPY